MQVFFKGTRLWVGVNTVLSTTKTHYHSWYKPPALSHLRHNIHPVTTTTTWSCCNPPTVWHNPIPGKHSKRVDLGTTTELLLSRSATTYSQHWLFWNSTPASLRTSSRVTWSKRWWQHDPAHWSCMWSGDHKDSPELPPPNPLPASKNKVCLLSYNLVHLCDIITH